MTLAPPITHTTPGKRTHASTRSAPCPQAVMTVTDKSSPPAKARRRRGAPPQAYRVVDWEIRPAPDGEFTLAFVAVTDPADTRPASTAGHSYQMGLHELRRLVEELTNELDPERAKASREQANAALVADSSGNEADTRIVLSAYGLLGN